MTRPPLDSGRVNKASQKSGSLAFGRRRGGSQDVAAISHEQISGAFEFSGIFGVHRDQRVSFFDAAEIAVHLVITEAKSGQSSCDSADGATNGRTAECGYDRSRRQQWPNSRQRK